MPYILKNRVTIVFAMSFFLMMPLQATEIDDLKALAKSKQWHKVMDKIDDIKPDERNSAWRKLLLSAAVETVSDPRETNVLKQLREINRLLSYDALKKNRQFNDVAGKKVVKLFPLCLYSRADTYTECLIVSESIVTKAMFKEVYAFELGETVRKQALFERVALPYYRQAVKYRDEGSQICQRPVIRLAVMSGLGQAPEKAEASIAREIVFGKCWTDLKSTLIDNLYSKTNYMLNACSTLLERDVLTRLKAKKCKKALAKAGL